MKICNGCGDCCKEMPCSLAMRIHGPIRDCPELIHNGKRYLCKIYELRKIYTEANKFCIKKDNMQLV